MKADGSPIHALLLTLPRYDTATLGLFIPFCRSGLHCRACLHSTKKTVKKKKKSHITKNKPKKNSRRINSHIAGQGIEQVSCLAGTLGPFEALHSSSRASRRACCASSCNHQRKSCELCFLPARRSSDDAPCEPTRKALRRKKPTPKVCRFKKLGRIQTPVKFLRNGVFFLCRCMLQTGSVFPLAAEPPLVVRLVARLAKP